MRIFLLDKFFIRHVGFIYLELKSSLLLKLPTKGKFKLLKRLYVRLLINYLESFKYYISKDTFKIDQNLIKEKNFQLEKHGIQFLKNIDINKFDFLTYNTDRNPKTATTQNIIDINKAELFAKNNNFHNLARDYLNVKNCNFYVASHNTYPYEEDERVKTNFWHRDRDGIRLVKIFVYLSDVGPDCGGHFYILGSHKIKPLRFVPQFRYKDTVIQKYFNKNQIIEIYGKKGTCFMEDTTGFHRGSKPLKNNSRSILSFTYFTGPLYYDENCTFINL